MQLEPGQAPAWVGLASAVIRQMPFGRYRLMNLLGQLSSEPFVSRMPRSAGEMQFAVTLGDRIAREVCFTGFYEPQETALVRALLQPGMSFVDVGANWGYFTLLASHLVGKSGRVVSFEPDPRLYELLQWNVTRNDLRFASPHQIAASSGEGTATLSGFVEGAQNRGISSIVATDATAPSYDVRTRAVDDVLDDEGLAQVDLLKMDIEGAEALALEGMQRGLAAGRYRRVILELHPTMLPRLGASIQDIVDRLLGYGYRGWWIDHSPETSRRVSYAGVDLATLLRGIEAGRHAETWPHTLWAAPGVELEWQR